MKHHKHRGSGSILMLLFLVIAATVPAISASANQASQAASSEGITLAGSGLDNPRGFAWGPDGTMYVTQAGTRPASAEATPAGAQAAWVGTLSGSVASIAQGCPVFYQRNLPSAGGTGGLDLGPVAVAYLNGQLYVLDEGGGAAHGNPLTPDGIYAIDGSGSARLVADIGAFVTADPVANPPEILDPGGDLVAMVAVGGALWVLEANSGQLLQVTTDGTITRVADLSEGNRVPYGLTAAPDGSIYVAFLTQAPYVEGSSSIVKVAADGTMTDAWTGLTAVSDVAIGPDGTLYAVELGTPDETQPLSVAPDSGRVLRQTGPDSGREIAVGLDIPWSMEFGPDQGLYVSVPELGSDPMNGAVLRLNLSQGQVMTMSDAVLASSPCVTWPTPTPDATSASTPASGDATAAPSDATPSAGGGGVSVSIQNFAFDEDSVTVPAGTTITWTNHDTSPHTVTSTDGSFDSGNIAPGETFTFTFTEAGTFDYICNYHPSMTGTVVVQ